MFPESMKDQYTRKFIPVLIKYFLKTNAVFVTALILNIYFYHKEKIKTSQDNKQFCAAILTDLSRAFNCICYDLPIDLSRIPI